LYQALGALNSKYCLPTLVGTGNLPTYLPYNTYFPMLLLNIGIFTTFTYISSKLNISMFTLFFKNTKYRLPTLAGTASTNIIILTIGLWKRFL